MSGGHRYRDWSELHGELVEEIILKIGMPEDVVSFSSVCRSWQTAFKRIVPKWRAANPWLLLSENTHDNPECLRKVYNPGNNKCYNLKLPKIFGQNCWGFDHGWVVTFGLDLQINLFNPLTKSRLGLPSIDTMMPEELLYGNCHKDCKYMPLWMRASHILKACVLKTGEEHNGELLVAVIHACKRVYGLVESTYLSVAKPGDARWTLIETPPNMLIRDVLFWKNSIWFVNQKQKFSLWYVLLNGGGISFKAVELLLDSHRDLAKGDIRSKIYLVESFNHELLLVKRHCRVERAIITKITRKRKGSLIIPDDSCGVYGKQTSYRKSNIASTTRFEIYKLDLNNKKWERDDDLAVLVERSMFLGRNTSLFVGAPKLGTSKCKSNCIYFAGDHDFKSGYDIGRCYLDPKRPKFRSQTVIEAFCDRDHTDSDICNPFWFTPVLY